MNNQINETTATERVTLTIERSDGRINQHVLDLIPGGAGQQGYLQVIFAALEHHEDRTSCNMEITSNCSPAHLEHLVDMLIHQYHLPYVRAELADLFQNILRG